MSTVRAAAAAQIVSLPVTPAAPPAPDYRETFSSLDAHRRRDGWTAERQHVFIATLAATGCVAIAAEAADITPRSAYRCRNHAKGTAFAAAWDAALLTASNRLTSIAFERAILGTPRTVWRGGAPHQETSLPSDRLLMFLLRHLEPRFFAPDADPARRAASIAGAQASYDARLAALVDCAAEADLLEVEDFHLNPPRKIEA